jgi:hypothetical protein
MLTKIRDEEVKIQNEKYNNMIQNSAAYYQYLLSINDSTLGEIANMYGVDLNNYKTIADLKAGVEAVALNNIITGNADLYNTLRNDYGIDLKNYTTLADAKKDVEALLLQQLAKMWNLHFASLGEAFTKLSASVGAIEANIS